MFTNYTCIELNSIPSMQIVHHLSYRLYLFSSSETPDKLLRGYHCVVVFNYEV